MAFAMTMTSRAMVVRPTRAAGVRSATRTNRSPFIIRAVRLQGNDCYYCAYSSRSGHCVFANCTSSDTSQLVTMGSDYCTIRTDVHRVRRSKMCLTICQSTSPSSDDLPSYPPASWVWIKSMTVTFLEMFHPRSLIQHCIGNQLMRFMTTGYAVVVQSIYNENW